jgi:Arc/MetJ-type ribon-helix-helix transcriptional regulator
MDLSLPRELAREVRELVAAGEFPDERAAVVELVRVGLSYRYRRSPTPAMPLAREPAGPRAPPLPHDVNWVP